jgi:nucleotide-binding universal stress UspA family protein
MYRVLLPVDLDEDRARAQARYVSRLPDASDTVEATVLRVAAPGQTAGAGELSVEDADSAVTAADHLESEGVAVTRRGVDGPVSHEVVSAADDVDADEIVIGGRKRSGLASVLLGSTANDLLRAADRPVTLTGETAVSAGDPRHVIVPVGESESRAHNQADYVAGLPGDDAVEATVLAVSKDTAFADVDAAVAAASRLEEAGVTVERVATDGEVAPTIVETADECDADCIVMGGRKRSPLQKVLLGSVSQDVVLSAERPVTITG